MNPLVQRLLLEDWAHTCQRNCFCFDCWSNFCSHCCPSHWRSHHSIGAGAGARHRVATVGFVSGNAAVLAEYPVGSRYDWTLIQRVIHGGRKWILLNPRIPPDMRGRDECVNCSQRTKRRTLYCCSSCKLVQAQGGHGRDMIEALVTGNYAEPLLHDRFCTKCLTAYTSVCCAEHSELHHPAPGGGVIEVVHVQGWAAVEPSHLVPEHVFVGVQVLHAGGALVYPLKRTSGPAVLNLDVGGHQCGAHNCLEIVPEAAVFCSLRCKASIFWPL